MASEAGFVTTSLPSSADRPRAGHQESAAPAVVDLGELSQSLTFTIRKAQLALQRRGLRSVSAGHVGPAEYGALVLCEQNPGMAQFQMAAALDVDKASVVAIVDHLEELGWLVRRRSSDDRRRYGLFLTAEGVRQTQLLRGQARDAESFVGEVLSPAEVTQLLTLLGRLA
jgi:DNA-binding MarR family transcriptional regulator